MGNHRLSRDGKEQSALISQNQVGGDPIFQQILAFRERPFVAQAQLAILIRFVFQAEGTGHDVVATDSG